tara:strand:- start:1646 stop:2200 length:555 start_codon:yes stop_codon:yes gene_type:complete
MQNKNLKNTQHNNIMPYKTRKVGSKNCVYKKGSGEKVGCTKGTEEAKNKYLAALHASADEEDVQPKKKMKTFKEFFEEASKEDHEPRNPGILKRRIKGKITCTKARSLKSSTKDKGSDTAKAAQRFINYHCDEEEPSTEEDAEKKISKTRAKCQAKAKRKYDVWPSAYASGYVQKCVNRGGNIK